MQYSSSDQNTHSYQSGKERKEKHSRNTSTLFAKPNVLTKYIQQELAEFKQGRDPSPNRKWLHWWIFRQLHKYQFSAVLPHKRCNFTANSAARLLSEWLKMFRFTASWIADKSCSLVSIEIAMQFGPWIVLVSTIYNKITLKVQISQSKRHINSKTEMPDLKAYYTKVRIRWHGIYYNLLLLLQSEAIKPRLKKNSKTNWFDSYTRFTWFYFNQGHR